MTEQTKLQGIHAAVLWAQRLAAERGIAKDSRANMGGSTVAFRGVEAAMNAMAEIFVHSGITLGIEVLSSDIQQVARAEAGKFTRFAVVRCRFTFTAEDGTSQFADAVGEAMDTGDKASTKAQSVALRIALFNKFLVPTAATSFDPELTEEEGETPMNGHPADVPERQDRPSGRAELPAYPKEKFEKNFSAWGAAVSKGTETPDSIIAKVSTAGVLTESQIKAIKSLKRAS